MSKEDFEKLTCEMNEKALNQLGSLEGLESFLVQILESFSYRYIMTESSDENSVQKYQEEGTSLLFCRSIEYRMGEALKCQNPKAKEGILNLAKSVPKKERPCVLYEIFLDLSELSEKLEEDIIVRTVINWDFPTFKNNSKRVEKKIKVSANDLLALRKSLPLALEDACDIF